MNGIQERKAALRRAIRHKGKTLAPEAREASDRKIQAAFFVLPQWRAAQTVFLYLSMGAEPDTRAILEAAWAAGKRVTIPRCLGNGVMEARQIVSLTGLTPKSFGILEPDDTFPLVPSEEIELVIAPCVSLDAQRNRLGNGGGYYDRFLRQVHCPVVCLCRKALMLEEVPTEAWDVPVEVGVTEDGAFG